MACHVYYMASHTITTGRGTKAGGEPRPVRPRDAGARPDRGTRIRSAEGRGHAVCWGNQAPFAYGTRARGGAGETRLRSAEGRGHAACWGNQAPFGRGTRARGVLGKPGFVRP